MEKFECNICIRELKINTRNKKIECYNCNYITCNGCQKKYEKPYCMNCNKEFTKKQIEDLLGKVFVKKFIIDKKIKELIEHEKILIPYSEELLKYIEAIELDKKLLRKGQVITSFIKRPIISDNVISMIFNRNCTKSTCNGTLKIENREDSENILICFICKEEYCINCLEIKENNHKCDENTLETIKDKLNSTKSCPKCNTLIYKIEGCSHMHCTMCNTHFDWDTKLILTNSTNHHYRHNINNLIRNGQTEIDCMTPNIESQIPLDVFNEKLLDLETTYKDKIIKYLYEDCNKIRLYFFEEIEFRNKYLEYKDDLRIKYMKNELSENNWGKLLYNRYKEYIHKQKELEIISYYINFIDYLQSKIYNNEFDKNLIIDTIIELYKCCNECFSKINDEFYCSNKDSDDFFKFTLPEEKIPIIMYKKCIENKDIIYNDISSKYYIDNNCIINLIPYQYEHYNNITFLLKEKQFMIDLSELGSGKTYTTCKYIQENKYDYIFIVCPPSLRKKWNEVTSQFGIKCNIINYTEIAGIRGKQPKHGLLYRDDFTIQKNAKTGGVITCQVSTFKETKLLNDIKTNNKVIFIFDEIQYLKQEYSNITQSCRILIKSIFENKDNKAIFISGTPFDKVEQFITFFKNVGIQKSNELFEYNFSTRRVESIGYDEIIEFFVKNCDNTLELEIINNAVNYGSFSKKSSIPYISELFLKILIPKYSSKMFIETSSSNASNEESKVEITNINTFYRFNNEDEEIIQKGLKKCIDIINNVTDKEIISRKKILIFKALQIIESAKIKTLIKETKKLLDNNESMVLGKDIFPKVVLCVNYTESIIELAHELKMYNPLILNGTVTADKRAKLIKLFQDNNSDYRLIIGNINIFCCGIDLDDKFGNYPRYVFVSPNFSTINLFQLSYRFKRSTDTKSNTIIRYIYSLNSIETILSRYIQYKSTKGYISIPSTIKNEIYKCDNSEIKIFNTLSKKSDLLKSIVNHGDSKYICNYDCEILYN